MLRAVVTAFLDFIRTQDLRLCGGHSGSHESLSPGKMRGAGKVPFNASAEAHNAAAEDLEADGIASAIL